MDRETAPPADEPIEITLEGGPAYLPETVTIARSAIAGDQLKIPHGNGYEHFELVDRMDDTSLLMFRWTMRTKIAE